MAQQTFTVDIGLEDFRVAMAVTTLADLLDASERRVVEAAVWAWAAWVLEAKRWRIAFIDAGHVCVACCEAHLYAASYSGLVTRRPLSDFQATS